MENFWIKLKKKNNNQPILCLAPMADVTDPAFRKIIIKYGKPDVLWTEFVSADGLVLAPEKGKKILLENLKYTKTEKPIVAQIFGSSPKNIRKAAKIIQDLGFDGLDINMGCPDRKIEKQNSGAAMIKNPVLAQKIIKSAQKGAPQIPVSVKIRLGYNTDQLEEWLQTILMANPVVIIIHARTRKEMSKVPAKWFRVKRAVEIRDEMKSKTLIVGNGDISSIEDANLKYKETGCDGVMVGRGILGNPWFFSGKIPTTRQKLEVLVEHSKLFQKLLPNRNFAVMKKHFKAYVSGFDGSKELRLELMKTNNSEEVQAIVRDFLK